jgi:hypothetical protein
VDAIVASYPASLFSFPHPFPASQLEAGLR